MRDDFSFYIDLVDKCNLRCPSCPRGNSRHIQQQKGRMTPELLDRIIQKATGECNVRFVHLYNWTEPFLHPDLSEMIEIVHSYGIGSGLSTNLNILPRINDVMAANPEYMLISVSGFTQQVYGSRHRGGDIERVKKNMASLAESIKHTKSKTRIEVKYLVYLGNMDEAIQMKRYVESLGFSFVLSFAGLMPLEKLLAFLSNGTSGGNLTEEDRSLAEILVFPHKELIELAKPYKKLPCLLLEEWLMINCRGNVQLCCMVYDEAKYTIADYLKTPISEIQRMKESHWQCPDCIEYGVAAARNWPIVNMDRLMMDKFIRYYAGAGFNISKVPHRGPLRSWILRSFQINRIKVVRSPWLRRQYSRFQKIRSLVN